MKFTEWNECAWSRLHDATSAQFRPIHHYFKRRHLEASLASLIRAASGHNRIYVTNLISDGVLAPHRCAQKAKYQPPTGTAKMAVLLVPSDTEVTTATPEPV